MFQTILDILAELKKITALLAAILKEITPPPAVGIEITPDEPTTH